MGKRGGGWRGRAGALMGRKLTLNADFNCASIYEIVSQDVLKVEG